MPREKEGFITVHEPFEAATIQTLEQMTPDEYNTYLRHHLFYTDHHDTLRSNQGGYPIATSPAQINALIGYLNELLQGADE